jgi:hypothetical protein
MDVKQHIKAAAFFLVFATAAIALFWVLYMAAAVAWGLFLLSALVLVVPVCLVWTLLGLLSFRTRGWTYAIRESLFRFAISLFVAAIVGDIFGVLTLDESHVVMFIAFFVLLMAGMAAWVSGFLRRSDDPNAGSRSDET